MVVRVIFFSYFKELAGTGGLDIEVTAGVTLGELVDSLLQRYPRLEPMRNSMLKAVGVDYQDAFYVLRPGDEVSLFPPVQGG
jgi:molybdopterin synthase sulfur carrier subunit